MTPFNLSFHGVASFSCGPSFAWPSGGSSTPHPLSCRGLEVRPASGRTSCGHLLVRDPLAAHSVNKTVEPFDGVAGNVAFVQSPGKLIDVPSKMLRADMVVDPVNAALQDRPDALNRVGGRWPTGILARAVVDRLMAEEQPGQIVVAGVVVGIQLRPDLHRPVNLILDCLNRPLADALGPRAAAAFAHPQNSHLTDRSPARVELLRFVLVPFLATDEAFIDFHDALKFVDVIGGRASLPQALQHKPRGLLSDTDFLRQLHAGDPLAGGHQQVHGIHPLVKWDVGPTENSTRPHGEIQLAGVAAIEATRADRDPLRAGASRTLHAVRPDTIFEVLAGSRFIGEELKQLEGADGGLGHLATLRFGDSAAQRIVDMSPAATIFIFAGFQGDLARLQQIRRGCDQPRVVNKPAIVGPVTNLYDGRSVVLDYQRLGGADVRRVLPRSGGVHLFAPLESSTSH